jgi:uncharacterized protein (DUF488 family)
MNRIAPKVLIGVLLAEDRPVFRTRLMKLLFMLRQQTMLDSKWAFYDFLPYRFGPYSFSVDRDILRLKKEGFLSGGDDGPLNVNDEFAKRARETFKELPGNVQQTIEGMVTAYSSLSDKQVVETVYEQFEEYTLLSELKEDKNDRPRAEIAIYTIGYEGNSIDGLLKALIHEGIFQVIDVRKNALSRNYGFHASTMNRLCEKVGIDYQHVPELGIDSEKRQDLSDEEAYQTLFEEYERETLSGAGDALEKVSEEIKTKPSTLLCYEADPSYCHRTKVAEVLSEDNSLPICNLTIDHE